MNESNDAVGSKGDRIPESARIAIVGAGPAGLSAAYYLKKNGYRHVVILERLGRVGGLCRTVTEDGFSFDLGANYITPAYKRVMRIAREHGAKMYSEVRGATLRYDAENDIFQKEEIWKSVREGYGTRAYLRACLRYALIRRKLRPVLDQPGFAAVERHDRTCPAGEELCVPFHVWLERNNLQALTRLFEIPITVMGYGHVDPKSASNGSDKIISAPYALKYMKLRTFLPMVAKFSPAMPLIPWPKRFIEGYQRLWERVAVKLDVRLNIDIQRIARKKDGITIAYTQLEQALNQVERSEPIDEEFDYLILTCPLSLDVLGRQTGENQTVLDLTPRESELFQKILTYSYALTACSIKLGSWPEDWPRILCTLPLPEEGWPWAITRQMEESETTQFYMLLNEPACDSKNKQESCDILDEQGKPRERRFVQGCRKKGKSEVPQPVQDFVDRTAMEIKDEDWSTTDRWPYFQHVRVEEMGAGEKGFYTQLEELQGRNRTFYGGALLNFELVENVMEYSEHLVKAHFLKEGVPSQLKTPLEREVPLADAGQLAPGK